MSFVDDLDEMPTTVETWKAATSVPAFAPLREDDMTIPALQAWPSWWGGRGTPDFIAREIVAPHGIADLAAVQFDKAALEQRAEAQISPTGDLATLRIVLACRRKACSVSELVERVCLSPSAVRRAARTGIEVGALTASGRLVQTHPGWTVPGRRIVAVELKRSDWQRATRQLWAYQAWASATWLVLGRRPPISALEQLHQSGVGLAYLDENRALRAVGRPKTRARRTGISSIWAAEQALLQAKDSGFDPFADDGSTEAPATWRDASAQPSD